MHRERAAVHDAVVVDHEGERAAEDGDSGLVAEELSRLQPGRVSVGSKATFGGLTLEEVEVVVVGWQLSCPNAVERRIQIGTAQAGTAHTSVSSILHGE